MAGAMEGHIYTTFAGQLYSLDSHDIYREDSFCGRVLENKTHCVYSSLQPPCSPAHTCRTPVTCWTSGLIKTRMAFPQFSRPPSPIPIGLSPGHLSRATSLHVVKAVRPAGATSWLLMRLANMATASHSSTNSLWKEDKRRFHPAALMPEGLVAPSVFRLTERIMGPSFHTQLDGGLADLATEDGLRGLLLSCLSIRMSCTVICLPLVLLTGTQSFRLCLPSLPCR